MKFFAVWVFILTMLLAAGGHASERQGTDKPGQPGMQASQSPEDTLVTFPDLSAAPVFDGIDPKEADRFWDHWQLMTVRYRKDNGEQRFIYANDIAWAAIKSGATTYPDGSIIGKVAIQTAPDPLFPNSLAPSRSVRIQLMRKDAKKYATHGGWGYAIYTAKSPENPTEEADVVEACHACHLIAEARDYIFARAAYFYRVDPHEQNFEQLFKETNIAAAKLGPLASEALQTVGHPLTDPIWFLSMPLFVGSLSESVGPLSTYAPQRGQTFLLIDERNDYYIAAKPLPANTDCNHRARIAMKTSGPDQTHYTRKGTACDGVMKWEPGPPEVKSALPNPKTPPAPQPSQTERP